MIELNYSLTHEDLLENQLYLASKSERFLKSFKKGRFIVPLIHLFIGCFLFFNDNSISGLLLFFGMGTLWYVGFPWFYKKRYTNHYTRHIKDTHKDTPEPITQLKFTDEWLEAIEENSESKINNTEFDTLIELRNHFVLRLKMPGSIIIPKRAITDISILISHFQKLNVTVVDETSWKW